ncbi:hypothetical protein RRG08_044162 [Elysia crispata]|uniref:Uncharacterized protein n=1 Tax=Elysia crispata TaxID=231223 RepID=A0AAE0XX02_9GAST|nr:hypothetical protein RRG08_044162 [Elysia crispata]
MMKENLVSHFCFSVHGFYKVHLMMVGIVKKEKKRWIEYLEITAADVKGAGFTQVLSSLCQDQWSQSRSALHCPARLCTALHCPALPCTALHCPARPCTALHCPALLCTALHGSALLCTALLCPALPCTALHGSAPFSSCITLELE